MKACALLLVGLGLYVGSYAYLSSTTVERVACGPAGCTHSSGIQYGSDDRVHRALTVVYAPVHRLAREAGLRSDDPI